MIGFPSGPRPTWPRRRIGPAFASHGMIAAAHPLTAETGLQVLKAGGNAVDAAVAAGLTAAVVMPEMCGLGGDLFAIVQPPGQAPVAVLGSGIAPRAATLEQMRAAGDGTRMPLDGPLSIGVPGMVHAYGALLERFGTQSLASLAAPAIGHAEQGFAITTLGWAAIDAFAKLIGRCPATAAVLMPGGRAPRPGEVLRQTDLARTLRAIVAEGPAVFYQGELARRMADAVRELGGALSADDLAGHETVLEPTIATTYRGHIIHQTGLPSQGMILLEALNIAENAAGEVLAAGDAAAVHILVEATKLAYADRMAFAMDPAFGPTPLNRLLSKPWAARRFAEIDPARSAEASAGGVMADGDTTYLCVVDADGMMVSLIQSVSSAFGSGVIAGDTGVILNNRVGRGFSLDEGHPNLFAPGKKTMHTLNCWSMQDADGVPIMVGGTPGGDGQPQWNLQMLVGLIDGGLDVQAATEAPRWSMWPGTDPANRPNPYRLEVETRLSDETRASLVALGHRLRPMGGWGAGGAAQIIARDPATGVLAGGSDPRVEGLALGF
ncbi:MAG TPA: gamma-glutamyltransferase family protein [Caulobacteraceae bacterium]